MDSGSENATEDDWPPPEGGDIKIDTAIGLICKPVVHNLVHVYDDLRHVFRHPRQNLGLQATQPFHVLHEVLLIACTMRPGRDTRSGHHARQMQLYRSNATISMQTQKGNKCTSVCKGSGECQYCQARQCHFWVDCDKGRCLKISQSLTEAFRSASNRAAMGSAASAKKRPRAAS